MLSNFGLKLIFDFSKLISKAKILVMQVILLDFINLFYADLWISPVVNVLSKDIKRNMHNIKSLHKKNIKINEK